MWPPGRACHAARGRMEMENSRAGAPTARFAWVVGSLPGVRRRLEVRMGAKDPKKGFFLTDPWPGAPGIPPCSACSPITSSSLAMAAFDSWSIPRNMMRPAPNRIAKGR
ncbi:hypothetical protein D187_006191 [Cystobacter fuscus DSM 2262]|uniref:Uncharacterized protein n=1 Tax=Cystobacter fuscus (strain ATCC 25194 / DSM 2262 / NBRC 100088 / M29) TaxID=1242864 RepID=S9PMT5_CYSF2|nr:hypothetical protein D187_006191 [Cystobacter fuscus DSM 2262]